MRLGLMLTLLAIAGCSKPATPAEAMAAQAKQAVELARRGYAAHLDGSPESVRLVEEMLKRQQEEFALSPTPQGLDRAAWSRIWGAYVGEVIRLNWGGEWSMVAGSYVLNVAGEPLGLQAKVEKRLTNGPGDNVWTYFEAFRAQRSGR